jgi:hypothetical protein
VVQRYLGALLARIEAKQLISDSIDLMLRQVRLTVSRFRCQSLIDVLRLPVGTES